MAEQLEMWGITLLGNTLSHMEGKSHVFQFSKTVDESMTNQAYMLQPYQTVLR